MITYSIVYGLLEQETSERLNIGILAWTDGWHRIRFSQTKMEGMKLFLPKDVWAFLNGTVLRMESDMSDGWVPRVDYLGRYSNNLLGFSPVQTVEIEPTDENFEWLYRRYVGYP